MPPYLILAGGFLLGILAYHTAMVIREYLPSRPVAPEITTQFRPEAEPEAPVPPPLTFTHDGDGVDENGEPLRTRPLFSAKDIIGWMNDEKDEWTPPKYPGGLAAYRDRMRTEKRERMEQENAVKIWLGANWRNGAGQ